MADDEDGRKKASRGNEWEVISLTTSTYAGAPGPYDVKLKDDVKGNVYPQDEAETTRAVSMFRQLVFPPNQKENFLMDIPFRRQWGVFIPESKRRTQGDLHRMAIRIVRLSSFLGIICIFVLASVVGQASGGMLCTSQGDCPNAVACNYYCIHKAPNQFKNGVCVAGNQCCCKEWHDHGHELDNR